jgi:hypothetical protein
MTASLALGILFLFLSEILIAYNAASFQIRVRPFVFNHPDRQR